MQIAIFVENHRWVGAQPLDVLRRRVLAVEEQVAQRPAQLGFDRERACDALLRAAGDVERAASLLLDGDATEASRDGPVAEAAWRSAGIEILGPEPTGERVRERQGNDL